MARVYETAVMLLLLSLLVLGIVWVASALLHHSSARESLYGKGSTATLETMCCTCSVSLIEWITSQFFNADRLPNFLLIV